MTRANVDVKRLKNDLESMHSQQLESQGELKQVHSELVAAKRTKSSLETMTNNLKKDVEVYKSKLQAKDTQLTAADEDNKKLQVALDETKRTLIGMRAYLISMILFTVLKEN